MVATLPERIDLEVHVTQHLVALGTCNSMCQCPIALAIVEALRRSGQLPAHAGTVVVTTGSVSFAAGPQGWYLGILPPEAQRFIHDFDFWVGAPPAPFSFPLTLELAP